MLKLDKSQITRNLGKKYKYVPFLEKAITTFEDDWQFVYTEKEHDLYWHPSGHCMPPATELYEIATGSRDESEAISGSLRKIFQVGHFWHQWLQYITLHKLEFCTPEAIERRVLRSWGGKEVAKVEITEAGLSAGDWKPAPFHAVAGSGDVAPLEAPGWTGIVDYKTMNANSFAQQRIPERFNAKYECQINIYMDLFDQAQAIILPINKDTGEFKEFLYERNQPLIDTIYEKWEFVSACISAESAPTQADDDMFELDHLLVGPIST
jgi:hypothetical protein